MNRFISTYEKLSDEEKQALKEAGIVTEVWYSLVYPQTGQIHAIFKSGDHCETYRKQFSVTSIVEPFNMIIKP